MCDQRIIRRRSTLNVMLVAVLIVPMLGCGEDILSEFKEKNKTHVAKVATSFKVFASRNGQKSPESQAELVAFLKEPRVAKNIERMGIDPNAIEKIFVSDRDGEPLKIKWGITMDPEGTPPIAFETVGVDGVRLVAADVVLEVSDDDEYEDLWNGIYEPQWMKIKKSLGDEATGM